MITFEEVLYFKKNRNAMLKRLRLLSIYRDHDGIRTHTSLRTPAPQAGKSTNFSTWPENKKSQAMLDFL